MSRAMRPSVRLILCCFLLTFSGMCVTNTAGSPLLTSSGEHVNAHAAFSAHLSRQGGGPDEQSGSNEKEATRDTTTASSLEKTASTTTSDPEVGTARDDVEAGETRATSAADIATEEGATTHADTRRRVARTRGPRRVLDLFSFVPHPPAAGGREQEQQLEPVSSGWSSGLLAPRSHQASRVKRSPRPAKKKKKKSNRRKPSKSRSKKKKNKSSKNRGKGPGRKGKKKGGKPKGRKSTRKKKKKKN